MKRPLDPPKKRGYRADPKQWPVYAAFESLCEDLARRLHGSAEANQK